MEGKKIPIEVDTGASLTVIPKKTFKENWGHLKLNPASNTLKTYSGSVLPLSGEAEVLVMYQGQGAMLPLIVADVDGSQLA